MTDYAQIIELPAHKLGDRWPASPDGDAVIRFGPITFTPEGGGAAIAPANALARVVFRFKKSGAEPYVIDSDAGGNAAVTILNAVEWIFEITTLQTFLPSGGRWEWDCALHDVANIGPITPWKGTLTPSPQV